MKKRVVVGMSGGVDSSVSAALLKEQGYEVIGVYVLGWTGDKDFPCNWQEEEADAREVAAKLEIPFYTINLSTEYEEEVINRFFEGYKRGVTPNPDILCNKEIKFKALWQAVRQFEPDFIATGHYAQIKNAGTSQARVYKGVDTNKDQTYFLWAVDRAMLPHILFPVGHLQKGQVRVLAEKFGLPTAAKKDSQGICFIGPLKVREFLAKRLKPQPGLAVLTDGRKIATHQGTELYTVGQRLGAGSVDWTGDVPPLFVVAKDQHSNRLIVGSDKETFAERFFVDELNWQIEQEEDAIVAHIKIRYRQKDIRAHVIKRAGEWEVILDEPVRAVTPGQSAVFYSSQGRLLGGGVITRVPEMDQLIENIRQHASAHPTTTP